MIFANRGNERVKAEPDIKDATCDICGNNLIPKCGSIKIWHWSHKKNKDCDDWSEPESEWHIKWKNEFPKEQQEVTVYRTVKKPVYSPYLQGYEEKKVKHRADIKLPSGKVIELQNSGISPDDIKDREHFYDNMLWLLNGMTLAQNIDIIDRGGFISFRWKFPPKSWWHSEKPIYIDLSSKIESLKDILKQIENGKKFGQSYSEEVSNDYGDGFHYENNSVDITEYIKNKSLRNLQLLENKPILFIKKIHHKIPCGGWGYLLSKEELLARLVNGN